MVAERARPNRYDALREPKLGSNNPAERVLKLPPIWLLAACDPKIELSIRYCSAEDKAPPKCSVGFCLCALSL